MEHLLGSRARKSEQSSTSAQAQQRTPTPTQHTHTKNISTLTAKEEKAPPTHPTGLLEGILFKADAAADIPKLGWKNEASSRLVVPSWGLNAASSRLAVPSWGLNEACTPSLVYMDYIHT